ncbi:MAG: hypothetical protein QUV05_08205 [Phycisphaerae bacterium]|nr:hypothetical protein [Phycisphaerae bacterium]
MANAGDPSPSRLHAAVLAAGFLFPADHHLSRPDDPTWRAVARWLAPWGLLIGLAYLFIFRVTWKWFGEYQGIRWLPAVAVLAVDLGFCGHKLLGGMTRLRRRAQSAAASEPPGITLGVLLAVLLVLVAKCAMLLSLPVGNVVKASPSINWYLPSQVRWFCPDMVIYRPLLLMPIWGRWAIGLALLIGRMSSSEPPWLGRMAAGLSLPIIFAQWFIITVVTTAYCALVISGNSVFIPSGRTLAYGLVISIVVMVIAYLASFLMARRGDGQTESSVLATGLTAELAFMALYLHLANLIYWF